MKAITGSRTPAPNANGWNNSAVTVSFQRADDCRDWLRAARLRQ